MLAEDWFRKGSFGVHPHRGMETVTCVLEGRLDLFDQKYGIESSPKRTIRAKTARSGQHETGMKSIYMGCNACQDRGDDDERHPTAVNGAFHVQGNRDDLRRLRREDREVARPDGRG
ncbi:pirin family protein [Paenibacillus hemerocallicola]|uniref:Pirin family protein n=1 Tax=Paenibacillus hemerocallicola TaxID=1172614 RepID=A0A5C4TE26_9BACL|nr:pirin family protein [Paenibacillus hemerocallicola]